MIAGVFYLAEEANLPKNGNLFSNHQEIQTLSPAPHRTLADTTSAMDASDPKQSTGMVHSHYFGANLCSIIPLIIYDIAKGYMPPNKNKS